MSDYLSNLVRRSFDPTAGVQPLLPSLFESSVLEPSSSETASSDLLPRSQNALPERLELESPNSLPSEVKPRLQKQNLPPEILDSPLSKSSFAETSTSEANTSETSVSKTLETVLSVVPALERSPSPSFTPVMAEGATRSVSPHPVSVTPQSPVQSLVQSPTRSQAVPRSPIQPQIVSSSEALPLAPEQAAAPTVRVTIGRIEVRAVASSTSPRPAAKPPKPSLDLEGYLKSRNGGRP